MSGTSADHRRLYLDNAATSWPKPPTVYEAVERYLRECGAAAGRGAYRAAVEAGRAVDAARLGVARVLGMTDPRRIVWTANATDALNLALHGMLGDGDHVVTTQLEHNSVYRPLRWLRDRRQVRVTVVPCDASGAVDPADVAAALEPATRLVVINHASNVTGTVQPLADLAAVAWRQGCPVLVDAAQTLGQFPWPLTEAGPLLVAAAGHKSLLGPLGVGFLAIGADLVTRLQPVRQGGTGTQSERDEQPEGLPERFESGNLNVPGIIGVGAGVEYVLGQGVEQIAAHHQRLATRLREELRAIPGIEVYGPRVGAPSVGVVSCSVSGYDPQEVAAILDTSYAIQVRSGWHCAPQVHRAIGSWEQGGTVRLSVGCWTTNDDVERVLAAFRELTT